MEGPLAGLLARHAAAVTGLELDRVSTDFEEIGFILYVAEAAAEPPPGIGKTAARPRGRRRPGRGADPPMPGRPDARADGSGRSRADAPPARGGDPGRGGADQPRDRRTRLFLSIRTVANAPYTIHAKTGVNDWTALAELLGLATVRNKAGAGGR